ncbi:hypothetical protein FPV67DRAFT_786643 [Lyophyllum atratum]|nr:hypothetical protein FPV67DRAFT_786643 [Lyophyllum atratum]
MSTAVYMPVPYPASGPAGSPTSSSVQGNNCAFNLPSNIPDYPEHNLLCKGFELLALAATFVSAIQAQIMSISISVLADDETIAFRAINAFFLSGLILDMASATLAFLTSRWLQRLTDDEKRLFEDKLRDAKAVRRRKIVGASNAKQSLGQPQSNWICSAFHSWLSLSLFVPMPLLILGVLCMVCGLYVYAWTQHSWIVATLFSIAGGGTLPFLLGVFLIGQQADRRKAIISRLSTMQGDW